MSRTTEESEKCDLQELEEHLNKIKECGEYIEKSYKNAKEKYDAIVKEDQSTVEYEKSFRKIIKHLQDVCKETVKKVKDLEENGLNKTYKTKQPENECVVSEKQDTSPPKDNDSVNKEQINGEEKTGDNRREGSESSDQEMVQKKKKKDIKKSRKASESSNTANTADIDTIGSKNGVEENVVPSANEPENANKATSSEQKKKNKENAEEKENLDKENEKPEENSVERVETKEEIKDPPKGVIRVISIEKLLDPSIAALRKRPQRPTQYSNLSNSSVIVLDSDDDEPSVPVAPQKDTRSGNAKQKEAASKTVHKQTAGPKVSKSTVDDRRKDESKKNQDNPKLKKVAVRLKSSKVLKEMLEEKWFKIKLSKLDKGLDSEPEPNKDRSAASAKSLRKRTERQKDQHKSSNSEEDDSDDIGRRKTNRAASKKARTQIREISDSDMDAASERSVSTARARRIKKASRRSSSSSEDESVASLKKKVSQEKSSGDEAKEDKGRRRREEKTKDSGDDQKKSSGDEAKKDERRRRREEESKDTSDDDKKSSGDDAKEDKRRRKREEKNKSRNDDENKSSGDKAEEDKNRRKKEEENKGSNADEKKSSGDEAKEEKSRRKREEKNKDSSDDEKKSSGDEAKEDKLSRKKEKKGKESSGDESSNEAQKKSEKSKTRKKKENPSRIAILSSSSDEDEGKKKTKTSTAKNDEDCSDAADQMSAKDFEKSGSSSDSAVIRKKRKKANTSSNSEDDMSNDSSTERKRKIKRKRIRHADDSDSSGNENSAKKRKNIRKVLKKKDLEDVTKKATREEEERKKRIEERQKLYNKIYEKPENVELKELVLDFDEESKEKLLSVDPGILKKLKPHQAAGIKFMWDACFETLKDTQEKPGSGCILAHCMGLGKTLQIVALTHTLLIHSRKTKIERVLVIAPLSTLNNWAREYISWMKFCKKRDIEIYDMSKWREKNLRVHKIKEWFEEGGVLIIGYDMYRILSNPKSTTIKKKQRESLQNCLVDPGPDLVVCDEGHLLKNEKTSLSQAVNKLRTRRRIVLTGTPLQNNLKEYYCMIQIIKPNLLGTYKEYLNRFVNPITNGQYTDSTERDIKLMKHRSHVLHKMLEGCIQRRDYSVLAPYLPPKHEYVVFITLTDMQKKLEEF